MGVSFVTTCLISPSFRLPPSVSCLSSLVSHLSSPVSLLPSLVSNFITLFPLNHPGEGWSWQPAGGVEKMTAGWRGVRLAANRDGKCPQGWEGWICPPEGGRRWPLDGEGWGWPPTGMENDRWAGRGEDLPLGGMGVGVLALKQVLWAKIFTLKFYDVKRLLWRVKRRWRGEKCWKNTFLNVC